MYWLLYPLRTYLIVSGRLGEEVNIMAADWVTIASSNPFTIAVAIAPIRYTYKLVKKYNEFVVAVPNLDMLGDVSIAGSEHGPEKLKKMRLKLTSASKVKTPIIENALANLECKVIGEHPYGDYSLFVGEVVAYHYREDVFRNNEPNLTAGFLAHLTVGKLKFATFKEEIYTP
jgi:flavin reductase (DIM6/NTAB) family NADH-FMN oxidoreductase RutF